MRRYLMPVLAVGTMMTASAAHAVQLNTASLFDGPPEGMVELRPEEGKEKNGLLRTYWMLGDIHKAGRVPHLVCGYEDGGKVVMKLGKTVKACIRFVRTDKKGNSSVFSVRCE